MSNRRRPNVEVSAYERVQKNCDAIRNLVNELNEELAMYHFNLHNRPNDLNWGDVGELAHVRSCLNQALGHEDKDPE